MFGLNMGDIGLIKNTIHQFEDVENALIFGSRAMGNYKRGSDVDIALKGNQLNDKTLAAINDSLNETSPLPYFFDVIHYESLTNKQLKQHIDDYGISIVDELKSNTDF